jgi:hypothetical protein
MLDEHFQQSLCALVDVFIGPGRFEDAKARLRWSFPTHKMARKFIQTNPAPLTQVSSTPC